MTASLRGINGTNPRDFLAAIGILRIVSRTKPDTRLSFTDDGAYTAVFSDIDADVVARSVLSDAETEAGARPWRLSYEKREKRGTKSVFDLKPPPDVFQRFLHSALDHWVKGESEGAAYAAAFATDVAVDSKGNTKPTAFHFTAANQQFLDTVEKVRASLNLAWITAAMFDGHADRSGPNLRWDPAADRPYALLANDPNADGTAVNAPLEWLAFRGLPLLPVVPRGARVETAGVKGRGDEMRFSWPLWSAPASISTVRSLVLVDWSSRRDRTNVGIIATCSSGIRRSAQGFGNFGPASVRG